MLTLKTIRIIQVLCLLIFCGGLMLAQDDNPEFEQIKKIFYQQEEDWNRGDIEAFMQAYWKSEDLQFGGASGITRGWQQTLENYKKGYPDKASMGRLKFQIADLTQHSAEVVSLTGSWELERATDRPGGYFLLIWRKIEGDWKIVVDHTSQKPVAKKEKKSFQSLELIKAISGNHILAGQHNKEPNADPDKWTRFIYETTGKYPALWTGDFLFQQDNIYNRWKMIHVAYNPGSEYWDIFGFDIYDQGHDISWYQYILPVSGNKPIAIGECSKLPTREILETQPRWVFFMPWAELVKQSNSPEQIKEIYKHLSVITRDEMPGWK